jgi:hypothetical protein
MTGRLEDSEAMKFSRVGACLLIGLAGLVLIGFYRHAQPAASAAGKKRKVMIYPSVGETIDHLRQQGIANVDNYGSYWIAETDDEQFRALQATHGDRAVAANYLNHVELRSVGIDTSVGEPAVPAAMQQTETGGRRLRLIQFKGPIQPEWLAALKGVGGVKVITYVPNSTYLVSMDAATEKNLEKMRAPGGPIQWVGAYHPSYKIPRELQSPSGTEPIRVRVAVVDHSQEAQGASGVLALGSIETSLTRNGQQIIEMDVSPSAIAEIAHLPDVLWIEKVFPKRVLDEVQDLVLAAQTNGPSHGPSTSTGITNYLDFLINTVGGGLGSFLDPNTYPVVDIADTGLDDGDLFGFTAHPAFHISGNPNFGSRVVYVRPPWLFGDPLVQFGCTTRLNEKAFRFIEGEDIDGHGTAVASIVAGYDADTNLTSLCLELVTVSNTVAVTVTCPSSGTSNESVSVSVGVTNVCDATTVSTNLTLAVSASDCTGTTNVIVAFTSVVINTNNDVRTDPRGFQLGMGVSPFGRIGSNRIFDQNLVLETEGCTLRILGSTFCFNDLNTLMAIAYGAGARIQNNSWADFVGFRNENGGLYTLDSQTYDIGVRDAISLPSTPSPTPGPSPLNQELVVVFACNNQLGDAGNRDDTGGFIDMRVSAPATAKNVISVGSSVNPRFDSGCGESGDSFAIPGFSAAGPTVDGRFKPEIVAPGSSVYRGVSQLVPGGVTTTNCSSDQLIPTFPFISQCTNPPCTFFNTVYTNLYACGNGSSFAAPAVSGGIQLLWWYFENRLLNEQGQHLLQPSPAMAKTYLCNSARYLPIANPRTGTKDTLPSILQGMGEMDLLRMFDGVSRAIRDESSPRAIDTPLITTNPVPQQTYFTKSGQSYEASGQIASNGLPFRVTLAWTDAPGMPFTSPELVNDLDLEVTVGGVTYKGNVFSEDHSIAGGVNDSINNMESVFLPAGGSVTGGAPYQVVVHAKNIAGDGVPNVGGDLDQDFALVVYNTVVNFPTLSDVPNLATNNACQTAINITQFPYTFTNTLSKAVYGNVHPSPSAAKGGSDEFFKLTRPTPGVTFTIDTFGSSFDTVLSVWSAQVVPRTVFVRGECGALTELVSTNHVGGGLQSQVSFAADGSNDYYIVVEPHNNGSGGTMVLNVHATQPPITITPASLTFSSQSVGTTSPVQIVTYRNGTTVPVLISDVSITGSNAADFVILSQSCPGNSLAPGIDCATLVAFAPTNAGPRQANLVFTDDATGSPRSIPLSGTAIPPAPSLCLGSSSINFGSVGVGATSSPPQTVTITNCGTAALVISNVFVTGANAGDFINLSTTCATVATGSTCMVSLQFAPNAVGTRSATLVISNNVVGSPRLLSLTGSGSLSQPDAAIGRSTKLKKMVGFGTNNTTGVKQEIKQNVRRGARHGPKYFVAVKNIGSGSDRFTVQSQQIAGGAGFSVNYRLGAKLSESVDVTAAVAATTLGTGTMGPGAVTGDATMIRVEIVVPDKTLVAKGTTAIFTLTFTSVSDPGKQDTVRITAVAR